MNIFHLFFRYRKCNHSYSKCYNVKENFILLERIRQISSFDFKLIQTVKYDDYIWWSYPNFKRNEKFESLCHTLDLKRDNGIPKCIIKVVEIINTLTYFNKQIRQFVWVFTWSQHIFRYDRYYRYLKNERKFGRKNFLNYRHGHKLHLISCIKNRELTGIRLNKNHMFF